MPDALAHSWQGQRELIDRCRAVIFDCDGTLTDSMPLHFRTWQNVMRRFGVEFIETRFYELAGVPAEKVAQIVGDENGIQLDVQKVAELREQEFMDLAAQVEGHLPVIQLADRFRQRVPIAVASGSYRASVTRQLTGLGIFDWFSAVVCAEDTERHKPEPDVFLEAARRIQVAAEDCVVFEDGDLGLEAARRAGMLAVDVRIDLIENSA